MWLQTNEKKSTYAKKKKKNVHAIYVNLIFKNQNKITAIFLHLSFKLSNNTGYKINTQKSAIT